MSELYPSNQALLDLAEEPHTGVEFIPTGKTPYYLEFRKLVHRLTLAAARSGDLRPYRDGDLSIGVKAGRCVVGGAAHAFLGAEGIAVANNEVTYLFLDDSGALQTGLALPADRSTFLPIARITTSGGAVTELVDLRGEAFLQTPTSQSGIWMQTLRPQPLETSIADGLVAVVPEEGTIDAVILTVGANIVSTDSQDGVEARITVGGQEVCGTRPRITHSDGAGPRSTAKGDGQAAIIDPQAAHVQAGDLLRFALTLITNGVVSSHPAETGLAIRIMPD